MGYARLPDPSAGDVFFDLEGDPYVGTDGGIEYLWGWWTAGPATNASGRTTRRPRRRRSRASSTRSARCAPQHPGMHVFHYAPHEASKLRSLSVEYATREAEVDDLLRDDVLVDLYAVVRQGLQVGEESYSLKKLERHHGFRRLETTVREGGGSIIAYETWLETGDCGAPGGDPRLQRGGLPLDAVAARLAARRDAAGGRGSSSASTSTTSASPSPRRSMVPEPAWLPDVKALIRATGGGLPADPARTTPDQAERRLLAHLLLYHRREGKPEWWRHFELRGHDARRA